MRLEVGGGEIAPPQKEATVALNFARDRPASHRALPCSAPSARSFSDDNVSLARQPTPASPRRQSARGWHRRPEARVAGVGHHHDEVKPARVMSGYRATSDFSQRSSAFRNSATTWGLRSARLVRSPISFSRSKRNSMRRSSMYFHLPRRTALWPINSSGRIIRQQNV